MKILFAASEVSPIVKIGGLGDVAGALPKALEKLGADVDVIVPYYSVIDKSKFKIIKQLTIEVPYGGKTHDVEVYKTQLPQSKVDVILLYEPEHLSSGGKDAFTSLRGEVERFAFFSRAVVEYVKSKFNIYDVIHCNDWHTGMITHLLEEEIGEERPATLFTIHNVAYQGQSDLELTYEMGMNIPLRKILVWDLEDRNVNFMLQGIASSDGVNAVSKTYASELQFSDVGGQMSSILRAKSARVFGILNGIDEKSYDPKTDKAISKNFDIKSYKEGKKINKEALQKELGLTKKHVPLVSMVTRIDPNQKGLDILMEVIEKMLELDLQLIILGKGDKEYEDRLTKMAKSSEYKHKMSVTIGFDEALARRIYASSDIFLMPSKTEPCGLAQMIAMRYGTLPVVHSVGGLKDTVIDGKDGFSFDVFNGNALLKSVTEAYKFWGSEKFNKMVETAMKKGFSWNKSAIEYKDLYSKVVEFKNRL